MDFIVIALKGIDYAVFDCRIIKDGNPPIIPSPYERVFGPANEEECKKWIDKYCAKKDVWQYVSLAQYLTIFLVVALFVVILSVGIGGMAYGNGFLSTAEQQRGLITFTFAVATIAIATLGTLTAMLLRDFKERFTPVKDILALMLGVLGTIIGFYFGQAISADDKSARVETLSVQISKQRPTVGEEVTLSTKLVGGKPPYKYVITFKPNTVEPIRGNSANGEINVKFPVPATPGKISFDIEGEDAGGIRFVYNSKENEAIEVVAAGSNPAATPNPTGASPPGNSTTGNSNQR